MHHYLAFDFHISSPIELELPPAPAECDNTGHQSEVRLFIDTNSPTQPLPTITQDNGLFRYGADDACIFIEVDTVGSFLLPRSLPMHVTAFPEPGSSELYISRFFCGLILPIALHLQPVVCFHGSAVTMEDGTAVMIIGDQGAGKSTTAAALAAHGRALLCDDVIPIAQSSQDSQQPVVRPGLPVSKLLPDAYARLVGSTDAPLHPWDGIDKFRVDYPADNQSRPLSRIILLTVDHQTHQQNQGDPAATAPAVESVQLTGGQKIKALQPHLQGLPGIDDPIQLVHTAFSWLGNTPLTRISRPAGIDCLNNVLAIIAAPAAID